MEQLLVICYARPVFVAGFIGVNDNFVTVFYLFGFFSFFKQCWVMYITELNVADQVVHVAFKGFEKLVLGRRLRCFEVDCCICSEWVFGGFLFCYATSFKPKNSPSHGPLVNGLIPSPVPKRSLTMPRTITNML